MTAHPVPTPLFHLTAIQNLDSIIKSGGLLNKIDLSSNGLSYGNIAHSDLQEKRSKIILPSGYSLHSYVPLFFAPRPPMLNALYRGTVAGCSLTQDKIVHLVFHAQEIATKCPGYLFTNGHAIMQPLEVFSCISELDKVDWDTMFDQPLIGGYAKFWQDQYDERYPKRSDRTRRRQAEFLVYKILPWHFVKKIVVMNNEALKEVKDILAYNGVTLEVSVEKDWYY